MGPLSQARVQRYHAHKNVSPKVSISAASSTMSAPLAVLTDAEQPPIVAELQFEAAAGHSWLRLGRLSSETGTYATQHRAGRRTAMHALRVVDVDDVLTLRELIVPERDS